MEPSPDRYSEPYVPNLGIGYLFARSWPLFKEHLWVLVGATAIYIVVASIGSDPFLDDFGVGSGVLNIVGFAITGPLTAGLYWMMLRVHRSERPAFGDLFIGFNEFGRAFGVYALSALATVLGLLLFVVPGIIIGVGLWPSLFLVMDGDRGVMDTLQEAWAMTSGYRLQLFLIGLVLFVLLLLGVLALVVGIFFTGAFGLLVVAGAYEELSLGTA
ncbi:MAG: hypothetical protein AAGI91_07125 [Bacteroidota bacterium]